MIGRTKDLAWAFLRHPAAPAAGMLAALVLWAPWPFGAVTPWAAASLAAAAGIACALAFARGGAQAARLPLATAVPAAALLAIALLGLLQSVPWPLALAVLVSPEHGRLAGAAAAALAGGVSPAGGAPAAVPLSLSPAVTLRTASLFAGLAAALLAAGIVGRWRAGRRLVLASVLVTAGAEILFGMPRWIARTRTLWGSQIEGSDRLRGSFVNPNHFAVHLEIALAVAFAWAWWAWRRARREATAERRVGLLAPPAIAWLTLFVALAFSGSRAGLAAALLAVAVQAAVLPTSGRGGRRRWLIRAGAAGAVGAAGIVAVLVTGADEGFTRLLRTSASGMDLRMRLDVLGESLELWDRFPWLGTGLGTYLHGFPLVQRSGLELTWWHAHSDPLELLVTGGVVAAACAGVGVVAVLLALLGALAKRHRSETHAAALAAVGALAGVGVHELADFGLTVAANSFLLAVVVGSGLGAVSRGGGEELDVPRYRRRSRRRQGADLEEMEPAADGGADGEGFAPGDGKAAERPTVPADLDGSRLPWREGEREP